MPLLELSDAAAFLKRSSALLLEAEAENNLLLSSALTLARSSAGRGPRLSFYVYEESGRVLCSALNAVPRRLLVSTADAEVARTMGAEMAARGITVKSLIGPSTSARAFADGLRSADGPPLVSQQTSRILRLEKLRAVEQAPGLWRPAKDKDARLLLQWSQRFVAECGLDEPAEETADIVHRYIENRQLFIWEDRVPVAMAGFGGHTPNGARVNMVYTDPSARSRGYAGSLVFALSRKLLSAGKFCFLFVDAENQAANKVYERLGYEAVGEFMELVQSRRPAPTSK